MTVPVSALFKPPYGLAFSIEELLLVRNWGEKRGLELKIALDQTLDGAEFEEMLILARPACAKRVLTLWRTFGSVFIQAPNGLPRAFTNLPEALEAVRPVQGKRPSIFRFFGRAS